MKQFIGGSRLAYQVLESRCRNRCITFVEQMPPGSIPAAAGVGFEVHVLDGSATLYVDRGVMYDGGSDAVRMWFEQGWLHFRSFDFLRRWIQNDLAMAYEPTRIHSEAIDNAAHSPDQLTDVAAIVSARERGRPESVDERAIYEALSERVRGQDGALEIVARRVFRHIRKRNPQRPLSLFLIGPTGVGKTRTVEVLADALRSSANDGSGYGYLRLDMSEYSERHRVSQMLGAPPGYIGYGDGAGLVDRLKATPKSIVLFDEIEKAHPDCVRTLMNAIDAGRLSAPSAAHDAREIDCQQAIFAFTSNIDASEIVRSLEQADGFGDAAGVDAICRSRLVASGVPPEFAGRIAVFLVFRPLSEVARAEIAALTIVDCATEYGVSIAWIEPCVVSEVLSHSDGVAFGARPDRAVVEDLLGSLFADCSAAGQDQPVRLVGPPFRCEPLASPARALAD